MIADIARVISSPPFVWLALVAITWAAASAHARIDSLQRRVRRLELADLERSIP